MDYHSGRHLKVLVADEHFIVRSGMSSILKRVDAETVTVFEAGSYAEVERRLQAHPDMDLIVLGLALPDRFGQILVDSVKTLAGKIPMIVVSDHDDDIILDDNVVENLCMIQRTSSLMTIFNIVSRALQAQAVRR